MPELETGKATLCIVNYKTLDFTRLCLRSIRRFTNYPYKVLVVDNNSQDESLDYLRSLDWIHLIERRPETPNEVGGYAHGAALDLGLQHCDTEYFVSLHSDTFVHKHNWLKDLLSYMDQDPATACVGTGKLEMTPVWRQALKKATDLRAFKRKLFHEEDPQGTYRYYNRTICCLYRTPVLYEENLSFLMGRDQGLTAGKKLYFELVDRGYRTVELPPRQMSYYVLHLAHATQVVNPREFAVRSKTMRKTNLTARKTLESCLFKQIAANENLDT